MIEQIKQTEGSFGVGHVMNILQRVGCGEAILYLTDSDPQTFEIRNGHIGDGSEDELRFVEQVNRAVAREGLLVVQTHQYMAWRW